VLLIFNFSTVFVMDNIIEPNETFDFSKLSLAHPTGIQGGAYFTKIHYNNKPLYIQTTKSLTRQGFVKNGKKYYCDLMFDKNADVLIHWFENLEENCQKMIFSKSNSWFQNPLDINDIESAFNSTIRVYKSGKYYLVRTNVKNNASNEPTIKIYDENEIPLAIDDVTNDKELISILEIQGIKFTSRNFQIEIELKQAMVMNNEPIFESCLIKTIKSKPVDNLIKNENDLEVKVQTSNLGIKFDDKREKDKDKKEELINSLDSLNSLDNLETLDKLESIDNLESNDNLGSLDNLEKIIDSVPNIEFDTKKNTELNSVVSNKIIPNNSNNIKIDTVIGSDLMEVDFNDLIEETDEVKEEESKILKEFDIDDLTQNNLETITLKKPNQVYFELYKEARGKAKQAKKAAIVAYLEAKNIRKTYMLENLNNSDSDSDFDAEIDEVSESELENF
jgi:hypothetical protein